VREVKIGMFGQTQILRYAQEDTLSLGDHVGKERFIARVKSPISLQTISQKGCLEDFNAGKLSVGLIQIL
jgi:hypothetical protein